MDTMTTTSEMPCMGTMTTRRGCMGMVMTNMMEVWMGWMEWKGLK